MEVLAKGPQTSKEIANALDVPGLNYISGRFSEMKQLGWIEETGKRRLGAAELRALKPMGEFELVKCPRCSVELVKANLQTCFICDHTPEMCSDCFTEHMKTHSEAELDAALTA